jgi:hypothetical protein
MKREVKCLHSTQWGGRIYGTSLESLQPLGKYQSAGLKELQVIMSR